MTSLAELGALGIDDDDVAQLGAVGADLEHLGELLGVFDEDRARVRVVEDVLHLLRRVRLVNRDQRGPGGEDSEAGLGPLGPGVGEDRDLFARLDSEVNEAERDLLDGLAELRVGDVDPVLADLIALRWAVRVLLGRQRQHVGDRGGASAFDDTGARGDCFHQSSPSCFSSPADGRGIRPAAGRFYVHNGRGATMWPRARLQERGPRPATVARPWPVPSFPARS